MEGNCWFCSVFKVMSLPLFKIKLKLNPLIQKSTHPNSHLIQKMEVLYDFSTKKSDKTQS